MVAIKNHEADRFLGGDIGGFHLFLVFGSDPGLVSERIGRIIRALAHPPGDLVEIVRLSGDEVAGDPGRLVDETGTVPMFGGRRLVRIAPTARTLVPAVEQHLESNNDCPVVVETGNLKKDAPLRRLVERARAAVAIECYPDSERDLARLIDDEAGAAGLTIEPDARGMLLGLLGADRLGSRSELAKLILYAAGRRIITPGDVEAIVTDASAGAADALVDAAFLGDFAAMERAGRRVLHDGTDGGTVLSAALRHATILHRAVLEGFASDRSRLPFGIAPQRKAIVERQLQHADGEVLARAVMRLGEAVGRARRDPLLARALAIRTLWTIARSVTARARNALAD